MDSNSEKNEEELQSRKYQALMEEIAFRQNTIIHLPTGSGKTFIAVRLIARFREALLKPWGEGGKRTFFLVNNVPLVIQQKKVIENLSPVKNVGAYSSEDKVDFWNKSIWDGELTKNQVMVMTSQILANMLTHQYIKLEDINLLIFDECHHAVDDHPMRLVMKFFEHCPPKKQPRVLGLTATLLNSNVTVYNLKSTLKDLETTFHATIAAVDELGEVLKYSTNPKEILLYYGRYHQTPVANEAIQVLTELIALIECVRLPKAVNPKLKLEKGQTDITVDPKKIVKLVKNMVSAMIGYIEEMGVYGGALGILAYIVLLEGLKRNTSSKEEEYLFKFVITDCLKARMVLLKWMEKDKGYNKIIRHSSPKIIQMLDVLKEYNTELLDKPGCTFKINLSQKPLSGIIFARQRFTAKVLYNLLQDVVEANPEEFGFLRHDFIVGFNVNPYNNTRRDMFNKKISQTALLKYCNKELNCLIATSVIEEGIDIRQCLLVLRYDPPMDYRGYIQSKGRGRSSDASYVIMVEESKRAKFESQYSAFQQTEMYIQEILVGKSDERPSPTKDDLTELYDEDEIPPYIAPQGGRLNATHAISLLFRYCSSLPHDQFTVITAMWVKETKEDMRTGKSYVISIILPIESTVKETIKGMPMKNLKWAKRSAALNACIRLHQAGELDAVSLLPKAHGVVDFETPDVKGCFLNWPWDEPEDSTDLPKAGTKNRVRKHERVFPKCLEGPVVFPPEGRLMFYIHVIKLKAAFAVPTDTRESALFDLLRSNRGYAFLTQKPMPELCEFPMFLTVGEVSTSIDINAMSISLNENMFEQIKRFNYYLFDQILNIMKKFVVYACDKNCLFVVPFSNGVIDWDVITTSFKPVTSIDMPPEEERRQLVVDPDEYRYAVVTPWYRPSIWPDRYIVSRVLEHLTPASPFPDSSENSFEAYYNEKYNLSLVGDRNQPLLEGRNISSRMNCLLPRAATLKTLNDKEKKLIAEAEGDDKPKSFAEMFIPEFCIKYDFPGALWYKAMMLPSIIHRVTMLLIADDLRVEIAKGTGCGIVNLPNDRSWKPLNADIYIAVESLKTCIETKPIVHMIDRINDPIDENAPRPPIKSMRECVYGLQKKKIGKDYPWDENCEPLDIERNLSKVTVMDIECYEEFVSTPLAEPNNEIVRSPPKTVNPSNAILPPLMKYNDTLNILKQKPNGLGPELCDVLAAITTIKSHDTQNLERMETLGDSFLKFAASLYLFYKFPTLSEGQLTNIKGRLIGNRNLYYAAERINLGGRMKIEPFSPRKDFLVPGCFAPKRLQEFITDENIRPSFLFGIAFSPEEVTSGELTVDSWSKIQDRFESSSGAAEPEPLEMIQNAMQCYIGAQAVSDKSVADCVEALIGMSLLSGGPLAAIKLLEWLRIIPEQDNLAQLLHKAVPTVLSEGRASQADIKFLLNSSQQDVEEILDYKFKDSSYLLEALSHPSYIRNRLTRSYERLEFLGDAILDFLITMHIFENCTNFKPGELTDLRSALVNNVTFASYVVKLGLHKFLLTQQNPALDSAIMSFVEHQVQRNHEIVEDVLYLIDETDCRIAEYIEVPKLLSDIFESLIGAIYLDSGGSLETVWRIVYKIMCREIQTFSLNIPKQPVRLLYESIHACPIFLKSQHTNSAVPKVIVPVTVSKEGVKLIVHGVGSNKAQAKRAAAKVALKILA